MAQENPRLFLDQFEGAPLLLDEATLAPQLFLELKRRVDQSRRNPKEVPLDIWITGSNQTLLQKSVQESLAGRASYFDLNTLSLHELGRFSLQEYLIRGGWPQLYNDTQLLGNRYLDDLISTFIEKDIVSAAGIERRDSFNRTMQLVAGRIGQLMNYSDIAKSVGADTTTVQSWISILELNGVLKKLPSFYTNINKRLTKAPKYYFEDVGMATRLQGWSEALPILSSPQFGSLMENIAISEVSKYFSNIATKANIYFVRSKEKVEVDLLIELPNQKFIAAEIKSNPQAWSPEQHQLIDSLKLNIVARWCLSPIPGPKFGNVKILEFIKIWDELESLQN